MAVKRKRVALMTQTELIEFLHAELGVQHWLVRKWIKLGQLPAPAINTSAKSRWWRRADIEAFLQGNQTA